jgi:hypothetical protein
LTTRTLLVGLACVLGTETIATNVPPVFVSALWPTNAILLSVLLMTPVRHWWGIRGRRVLLFRLPQCAQRRARL